jgi:hypothetical protein
VVQWNALEEERIRSPTTIEGRRVERVAVLGCVWTNNVPARPGFQVEAHLTDSELYGRAVPTA